MNELLVALGAALGAPARFLIDNQFRKFTNTPVGIFLFVVNAAMLSLTARWSDKLDVSGFWSALFASLIISTITTVFKSIQKPAKF